MIALLAILFTLALAACIAIFATNIVLVGIAVALGAIVVIADAFLDVLAANTLQRVFVAAVAGVAAEVVAYMAGHASGVMVAVKLEMLGVIESRRRPFVLTVALTATAGDLLM